MKSHCNTSKNASDSVLEICTGKACAAHFSEFLIDRARAEKKANTQLESIHIQSTRCQGNCRCAPNVRLKTKQKVKKVEYATGPKVADAMNTVSSLIK